MKAIVRTAVLIALAVVSAGRAQAGTIFTNEADFLAALGTHYTETYASFLTGAAPLHYSGNGLSYDLESAARVNTPGAIVSVGGAPYAFDPNALLSYLNDLVFDHFSGGGFDGFGGYFYNSTLSGSVYSDNVNVLFSDGTNSQFFQYGVESFPKYFGYIASPGTKLTYAGVFSPHLNATIDRLTVGSVAATPTPVPEPGVAALLVPAVLAIGLVRRFRKRPLTVVTRA